MAALNGKLEIPNRVRRAVTKLFANLYTLSIRLPWVIAVRVIGILVIHGLTQDATSED